MDARGFEGFFVEFAPYLVELSFPGPVLFVPDLPADYNRLRSPSSSS